MKKLVTLIALIGIAISSCTHPNTVYVQQPVAVQQPVQQDPDIQYGDSQGQQVVYVHDNTGAQYMLTAIMFNQLMASGGYGAVYGYHTSYPTRCLPYNRSYFHYNASYDRYHYRTSFHSSYNSYRTTHHVTTTYHPSGRVTTTRTTHFSAPTRSVRPYTRTVTHTSVRSGGFGRRR